VSRSRSTPSGPAHAVDVGPFWIGRVPVSNRPWREFIGKAPNGGSVRFASVEGDHAP
jgi:formylglycine-generating enzyme required for sulfatase activity